MDPETRMNSSANEDTPMLSKGKRRKTVVKRFEEVLEQSPENIVANRDRTKIKADLQSRMLQATMQLARRSFESAKAPEQKCWFNQIPNQVVRKCSGHDLELRDFQTAFDLVYDWYPKLHEQVRVHKETWQFCTQKVLCTMRALLQDQKLVDQDISGGSDSGFQEWVDGKLEDMDRQISDEQTISSTDCYEDPRFDEVRQNLQAMHALLSGSNTGAQKASETWWVAAKTPFLRIMWIILMLDFCLMYEAGSLGMLTQAFLELNIEIDKERGLSSRIIILILLPPAVLLYSIFGSILGELVHGSFEYPPFQISRARLTVALTPLVTGGHNFFFGRGFVGHNILFGDDLDRLTLKLIDRFYTDALFFLTACGAVLFIFNHQLQGEDSLTDAILDGLSTGAFCWTSLFVVLVLASRVYCNLWMEGHIERSHEKDKLPLCHYEDAGQVVFRPMRAVMILREAFQTYGILPGEMSSYFIPLQRFLEIHKHEDAVWNADHVHEWIKEEDKNEQDWIKFSEKLSEGDASLRRADYHWVKFYLVLAVFAWLMTGAAGLCVEYFFKSRSLVLITINVGITVTVFFALFTVEKLAPTITGPLFRLHSIIFVVLICGFSYLTSSFDMEMDPTMTAMMRISERNGKGVFYNDGRGREENMPTPYPVCSMSWGSPQAPVRILDLAAMSYYAYANETKDFDDLLSETFHNAERVYFDNFTDIPRVVATKICGNNTRDHCTVIVAVKGTSNKEEIMTDLGIFATIAILQMLDIFAPLLGTVPKALVSSMVDFFRMPFMRKAQAHFIDQITETVKNLQKNHSNHFLVLTGHSLGGNFAELAGAKMGIPAIGFSAPGQFYMMKTFEVGRQNIDQNIVTIMPSMDPVPHVVKHVDVLQRILCRRPNGRYRTSAQCHSIEATGCEIWRVCGDVQERNFAAKCLDEPPNKKFREAPFVNESCVGQRMSRNKTSQCRMRHDR
mmetsp:Transcript_5528/g.10396  ORF Transcript_5528/g.10396 Transcript_5528/m.10396 type:complete len:961 (-) Transcript_5528:143-3025(-)